MIKLHDMREDTERYGMVEYTLPLIESMEGLNQAEYIKAAANLCKPWLAQQVELRNYKVLAGFLGSAYSIWKYLAGPTPRGTRETKMAATETLRRAERALILAIKAGQEKGEIGKQGEIGGWAQKEDRREARGLMTIKEATGIDQPYLQELRPMAAMPEEEFEDAVAKARQDGRLSRASILRIAGGTVREDGWIPHRLDRTQEAYARRRELIRQMAKDGRDSRQMQEVLGTSDLTIRQAARDMGVDIPADQLTARTKRLKAGQIVSTAIDTLEGVAISLDLADMWSLDRENIRAQRMALQRAARRIGARAADMREVEESDREHGNASA